MSAAKVRREKARAKAGLEILALFRGEAAERAEGLLLLDMMLGAAGSWCPGLDGVLTERAKVHEALRTAREAYLAQERNVALGRREEAGRPSACLCRKPRRHPDCGYCGNGVGERMCGECREAGIDGRTIPGTGRVVCKEHRKEAGR